MSFSISKVVSQVVSTLRSRQPQATSTSPPIILRRVDFPTPDSTVIRVEAYPIIYRLDGFIDSGVTVHNITDDQGRALHESWSREHSYTPYSELSDADKLARYSKMQRFLEARTAWVNSCNRGGIQ